MLVLSRRTEESILIGTTEVRILKIRGGRVSLGITAPQDILIQRKEIEHGKRDWTPDPDAELRGSRPK